MAISNARTHRGQDRQPHHRRPGDRRARGHDDLGGCQGGRDRDSGPLPRRALRPRRRVSHVCRGCRGARLRGGLRAAVRGRHGGQDRDARARPQPRAADRAAAGRPAAGRGGSEAATTADNELLVLVRQYGLEQEASELARGSGRGEDFSNPVIAVNHDACILCDRCVRACDDIQGNDVIGRSGKGYSTRIAFDLNDPMGESSCVTCGECVAACPTGALTNKPINDVPIRPRSELRQVDTVCPYCGVGCALTFNVDDERKAIAYADGRSQPGSQRRLCVKGRYGWDYSFSKQRLTTPLIRRESSYPKGPLSSDVRGDEGRGRRRKPGGLVDYEEVMPHFREATWEEALDLAASRLKEIHAEHGSGPIAGFGSAKCSNEEAYLFQKLIRAGFGTNNIDDRTRLCHASSVAALFEGVGWGRCRPPTGTSSTPRSRSWPGRTRRPTTGGFVVLQAGAAARHEADRRRPAPRADRRPRRHLLSDQARDRRRLLQRRHARGHPPWPHRPRVHRRAHVELRGAREAPRGLPARARRADHRHRRRHHPPRRAPMGRGRYRRHLLGHGDLAAHDGHRQRALPDRDVLDHWACRQAGSGAASAARSEQRAGRVGRRPDPDVLSGLPAGGRRRRARALRVRVAARARSQARPDRHGDRRVRAQGRGTRHVHDGQRPVPVGPEHQQGPQGTERARLPRRPGHLPDRDRRVRRRHPPRDDVHGEGRDVHEHRPARADRPQGARPAR